MIGNMVGPEIAGALASFWANAGGSNHASISTALALAGYDGPDEERNKQERVLFAIRRADDETAKRLVEELLNLLRTNGVFDAAEGDPKIATLHKAFERREVSLSPQGFVDWGPGAVTSLSSAPTALSMQVTMAPPGPGQVTVTDSAAVPTTELLISSLRRLASALRPLMLRRHKRPGLTVRDEYDLQDVVEALLRCLYNDVRPEERTPSSAGSSSVIDFLLEDDAVAVEVKITTASRGEKHIKQQLLIDINDYERHPSVRTLVAVVYDLASVFSNPTGFEKDLTRKRENLDVRVLVVGWPLPSADVETPKIGSSS